MNPLGPAPSVQTPLEEIRRYREELRESKIWALVSCGPLELQNRASVAAALHAHLILIPFLGRKQGDA
jgi:hypothetical protein